MNLSLACQVCWCWPPTRSDQYPINFVQGNLIPPAVAEFGRAGGFVVGDRLRRFDVAAALHVAGNALVPELWQQVVSGRPTVLAGAGSSGTRFPAA